MRARMATAIATHAMAMSLRALLMRDLPPLVENGWHGGLHKTTLMRRPMRPSM